MNQTLPNHSHTTYFQGFYKVIVTWISCCIVLIVSHPGVAQTARRTDSLYCATVDLTDGQRQRLDEMAKFAFELKKASGKLFADITHVPIRPHIFRATNGQGGLDLARLNNAIALTNSYYQSNGVGIQFYLAGTTPDYIDDDELFRVFPAFDESGIEGRDAGNAMNMYFVNAFSESGLGGYAQFPEDDVSTTRSFILANASSTENGLGNQLIPHELGHSFNLFHTFQGSTSSTPELVTRGAGANCSTVGDLLCDTPADPYGRNGSSITYVNNCPVYAGTATDPTGMTYSPSISNIMSYYFPCTHDFTPGQYDRMQAGLALRQSHTAYSLNYPPSLVNAPTNLLAQIGTSRNVILNWQDNADNEMGYFVERSSLAMGPFVAIGGTAPNVTFFTDTKASVGMMYFYRVRPSNTTTEAISNVVSTTVIAAPACVPAFSLGCTQGDGLNSLFLNGHALSQQSGCSPNAYHEFPVSSLTVTAGQVCNLSGQFLNGLLGEGITVWFDLNRDGVYTSNERYLSTNATGAFSGSLMLPASLTTGPMGMRVIVTRNYTTGSACVADSYGETEDYTIWVTPTTCDAAGGLASLSVTTNSAQLNWASVGDAFSYELRWKSQGNAAWTTVSGLNAPSYSLTGLTTGTGYQWQVRSICLTGNSAYSGQTFITSCPGPTNLTTTAITGISALLSWSGLGAGRTYDLAWRTNTTNSTWQVVEGLTSPTYSLTGLREGTAYIWQVRSVCTATGSQAFVAPISFATSGTCRPIYVRACTDFDGLDSFMFNQVPLSLSTGCSGNGYRRFAEPASPVTTGRPYSFSGTLLSNVYYEGIGIWLDLDRNGIFESSERVYGSPNLVTSSFSGSLTIPATATPGPMALRVVVVYSAFPTDACGNYGYGETEDYVLNIYATSTTQITSLANPACLNTPQPVSFGTTGAFGTTNIFSVQLSDQDGLFTMPTLIGSVSSSVGGSLTVTIPSTVVAGDGYRMRVISSSPAITITPSTAVKITSVCSCPLPASLATANLTGSAAQLAWVCDASVNTYSVRWRVQGSLAWTQINGLTVPEYSLRNLSSATTYEWQVLANCVNGQASDWVNSSLFQTVSCGKATLSGLSQTVTANQAVSLTLSLTGQNPWAVNINRNGSFWTSYSGVATSPFVFTTTVPDSSTFTLGTVSNSCGTLITSGTVVLTVPQVLTGVACMSMVSVKTGLWTDPTVWSCNRVPHSLEAVQISTGHVVTIPANITAHAGSLKQDGKLVFEMPNSVLRFGFSPTVWGSR